jgi:hypothetical protein
MTEEFKANKRAIEGIPMNLQNKFVGEFSQNAYV